jgi:hypothetical protein
MLEELDVVDTAGLKEELVIEFCTELTFKVTDGRMLLRRLSSGLSVLVASVDVGDVLPGGGCCLGPLMTHYQYTARNE